MKEFNFIPEEYLYQKNLKIDIILMNIIKIIFGLIILGLFILNKNNKSLSFLKKQYKNLKSKSTFQKYQLEENSFYLWDYSMNTLKNNKGLENIELNKDNLILKGTGDIKTYENLLKTLEDNKNIRLLEFKSPDCENEFKYTVIAEVGKNEK